MSETHEKGGPFFFATQHPPSATAVDEDIYLTETAAVPTFAGQVESIEIILSIDYARHVIAQLSGAVVAATKNVAH